MATTIPVRRTTLLVGLLAGCLVVAGLGDSLWSIVTAPLAGRQAKLRTLQQTVEHQETQFLAIRAAEAKHRSWQSRSLPADISLATTRYQHWITDLLREFELDQSVVTLGATLVRSDHLWVPVQIESEASPTAFANILSRLNQSPVLQRIKRMQVQPAGGGENNLLRVSFQVEALALTGPLAVRKDAEHDPFAIESTGHKVTSELSDMLAVRNPFAVGGAGPISMTSETLFAESSEQGEFSPEEESNVPPALRLVAILVQDHKKVAWLFDSTTQQQYSIEERRSLELPMGRFEVVAIQSQFVEFRTRHQHFRLGLGETLVSPSSIVEQTASNRYLSP